MTPSAARGAHAKTSHADATCDAGAAPGPANALWTSAERGLELLRLVLTASDAPVGETPKDLIWRKNKSHLYRYRRATPATRRTPIFLCMPLINRAYILDLRPGASFVEYLLAEGFDVFLYDWGVWGVEDRNVDLTALVARYLPRAVARASEAAGGADVTLLGYCIGGVLATCFTALHPEAPVRNLVLFTTPIDFADAGQFGRWTKKGAFPIDAIREVCDTVPGKLIELGAKMLNPLGSAVGTYVQLAEKLENPDFDATGWQAMYRWVNEDTPFPGAAYHEWITRFYHENALLRGALELDGRPVRLSAIRLPILNVAADADTIAPRPTTSAILSHVGSRDREELLVPGGHVGIVVGRGAKKNLWPRVADWLVRHDG